MGKENPDWFLLSEFKKPAVGTAGILKITIADCRWL